MCPSTTGLTRSLRLAQTDRDCEPIINDFRKSGKARTDGRRVSTSADDAAPLPAVRTDWTRTPAFDHALCHCDGSSWAAGVRMVMGTELDED